MRFKSSFPLILSLPLLAIAAPNGPDSATSTETSTETRTITHTQLRATLTSTYPAPSYFPLLAATDSVPGDIPNPTLAGSGAATQILVALSSSSPSTSPTIKARSSVTVVAAHASGTAPGTATAPLVLASATNLATAPPPIAPYTGAAAGMRGWGAGVVLVGAAVGFAAAWL